MVSATCPALLVSAPASGQGKTLCSAALARAWRNKGHKVQAFKCGPDFLDPMILQAATGRPVYNLDLGMCGADDGARLLFNAALDADVILVEGVMGLYDGQPSSADLAIHFGLRVMLTIDASAMAQTFGALASGLLAYNPALKPAGVIANQIGSPGHADFLRGSLPSHLEWFGALAKDDAYVLPERHLGLHLASEIDDLEARIEAAAQALASTSDLALPPKVTFHAPAASTTPQLLAGKTIAVARDEAFCFIYPANLDCLQALGASLVFFSPLHDADLPETDAIWLPGGYPELHTALIANNASMRQALHAAFAQGVPMLAECGGMMALSESVNDTEAFGLLPGNSHLEPRLQGIGTQHIALETGRISAHTFHHGVFTTSLTPLKMAEAPFGKPEVLYQHGSLHASFLHFYFASNPLLAASFFLP